MLLSSTILMMNLLFCIKLFLKSIVIFLFICQQPSTQLSYQQQTQEEINNSFRLPKSIKPTIYKIILCPNLDKQTYQANVTIYADCITPTNSILLNGVNFKFQSLIVKKVISNKNNNSVFQVLVNASEKETLKWKEKEIQQQIEIPLNFTLEIGNQIVMSFVFEKALAQNDKSFYYKEYNDDGSNWKLATTSFEPFYARHAFPCFDEPAMKAIFQFQIIRNKNLISLFNTRRISTSKVSEDLELDEFEETPRMSTYLLMFVICPKNYEYKELNYRDIKLKAYAPKGELNKVFTSLNNTRQAIILMENRTGIPFPGNKLDIIVIPGYAGGMENWGLVAYGKYSMLITDDSDDSQRIWNTMVTTHEVVHHWFGNYVTMKWWNDLWIKEGITTYIDKDSLTKNRRDGAFFRYYMFALNQDVHFSSIPLSLPDTFNKAEAIFAGFIYAKGCTVMNMMEKVIGRKKFDEGLKAYLHRFRYGSADSYDFWNAMTDATNNNNNNNKNPSLNLTILMEPWMKETNFPLVHVNVNANGKSFTVRQERFMLNTREIDQWQSRWPSKFQHLWNIPLMFTTSNNATEKIVWLNNKEQTFELKESVSWIKLNYAHYGYYVTNYDNATWKHILQNVNNQAFDLLDIGGIVLDVKLLLKSGQIDIIKVFNILPILATNPHWLVWQNGYEIIQEIYNHIKFQKHLVNKFKRHMREIVVETMKKTGYFWNQPNNLTFFQKAMQTVIFKTAILVDENVISAHLLLEFEKVVKNPSYKSNQAIAAYILPYGIAKSGNKSWEIIWERYKTTADNGLLTALTASNNCHLLKRLMFPNNTYIDDWSTFVTILTKVAEIGHFPQLLWKYFIFVSSDLNKHIKEGKIRESAINQLLLALVKYFHTEADLQKVKSFFTTNILGQSIKVSQPDVLEIVLINIKWHNVNFNALIDYYERKYP